MPARDHMILFTVVSLCSFLLKRERCDVRESLRPNTPTLEGVNEYLASNTVIIIIIVLLLKINASNIVRCQSCNTLLSGEGTRHFDVFYFHG